MQRLLFLFLLVLAATRLAAFDYYISPSGSDSNAGTLASPFATIAKARDTIRALKSSSGLPSGGVTVWLRGGSYNLPAPLMLDSRDSGTAIAPIVYAGWPGEQVSITGATALNPTWFSLVTSTSPVWSRLDPTAQGKVYSVDLRAHGITDFGTLKPGGFNLNVIAALELFCNGQPMTLARWPNASQPFVSTLTAPTSTQITYSGTRPTRWTQAPDIWLHGLWNTTWADYHIPVASINTASKTISFASAPPLFGTGPNQPYYAYNLLEEIDQPGEYYLDRTTGILYFWPTVALAGASLQVSMVEGSLLLFNGCQYVTLSDLTIEASRGPLLQINSGDHNLALRCLFRNGGEYAALVNGSNNGVDQCEIVDCGEDGVILQGGIRASLTAGNNFVTNCRIHRVGRINWAYNPAVYLNGGCGNRVAHNLIDELPHSGVLFTGNNHVMEYNEIRQVCQITSDAGAIYSGRDWGYRGNIIRYNFIHHIQSSQTGQGAHGVFLDDCMSSAQIFSNIFYQITDSAIANGGGRDHVMTNNLIANCGIGHFAGDYARTSINNIAGDSFNLLERLAAEGIQYQAQPWASAYPSCAAIPNSWAQIQTGLWRNPQNCVFSNNAGWGNGQWLFESNSSGTGVFSVYAAMANNNPAQAALFNEDTSLDRTLRPAQLVATVAGFIPVPFASIGRSTQSQPAATLPPPTPVLSGQPSSPSQIDLQWTDNGNLSTVQETGFDLERRNDPSGGWQVVRSFGPDVDFCSVTGLAPSTSYSFRVRAYNAIGSAYSNVISLVTQTAPFVPGISTRIEAENAFTIISDVGSKGTIGIANGLLDSGASVRLYDVGDVVRIPFTTTANTYRIGLRVRSGDAYMPIATSYWPAGYLFKLDGNTITLKGDPTTLSAADPSFGVSYWGTMYSDSVVLTSGTHSLDITSAHSWALVDYLEFAPFVPAPVTTFNAWQQAHFSTDQIASSVLSGWSAIPVGDSTANLLKYALGLDPWTAVSGSIVQVSLSAGQPQLTFMRPIGPTDLNYFVEVSQDGNTWISAPQTSLGQSNGIETMQATETGTQHPLIRLRVTCGTWIIATSPLATGVPNRIETDSPLTVLSDAGTNGTVGVSLSHLDNGNRVRLFDAGDAIRATFASGSGTYQIGIRVRSGDGSGQTSYWPGGYLFKLDGIALGVTGDPTTVSALDSSFGPTYWGIMYSAPVVLTAGVHTVDIISARSWALADYVVITPVASTQSSVIPTLAPPTAATIDFTIL